MSLKASEQELAEQVGRKMYELDVAAKALGITLLEIGPGFAKMSMTIRADMLNGHGIAHGGMTFALADTTFAYACNSRNQKTVALACAITYTMSGRAGDLLTAVGREQTLAGKSGVYDITVTNQNDEVIALFRGNSHRTSQSVLEDTN